MTNVLVGLVEGAGQDLWKGIEKRIRTALDNQVGTVDCAATTYEFQEYLQNQSIFYNLIVAIDNLGFGYEYNRFYEQGDKRKWIVVVPERSLGSAEIAQMLERGITNAVFQTDFTPAMIQNLFTQDRSYKLAKGYYGLETGTEVAVAEDVELDSIKEKGSTRYYQGVKITRICGADVKRKQNESADDEDEVLAAYTGLDSDDEMNEEVQKMPIMEFVADPEWTKEYIEKLRNYFRTPSGLKSLLAFQHGEIARPDLLALMERVLEGEDITAEQISLTAQIYLKSLTSYGKLDILFNTDGISDVRMLNKDTVNVQYKGCWYKTNITFDTQEEYSEYIKQLCVKNKKSNHITNAQTRFTDIDTNPKARLRFQITNEILSADHTSTAHIRKIDKVKKTDEELIQEGFWKPQEMEFLKAAVRHKKSIIILGESGSGKTVALNRMLEWMNPAICGQVVQESDELFADSKPNLEFSHSITEGGDDNVQYTLRDITTAALLKNAELFIIGEIKGAESSDFLTAANNGAQVITTTHTDSVFGGVSRLADLAKTGSDYDYDDLIRKLANNLHYLVHMEHYHVHQIAKIVSYDESRKDIIYDLYEF